MPELRVILSDGYDRDLFETVLSSEPLLERRVSLALPILPHARVLLEDLFCVLFKLNTVLRAEREVSPAVLMHRHLIKAVLRSLRLPDLLKKTQLDAEKTKAALGPLFDRVLLAVTKERRIDGRSLQKIAEVTEDERRLEELLAQAEALGEVSDELIDSDEKAALRRTLEDESAALRRSIEQARKEQVEALEQLPDEIDEAIDRKIALLPNEMEEASETLHGLGVTVGQLDPKGAEASLALGDRLMRSKKLKLLAKLTGALRELAFRTRRGRVPRAQQELHAISKGSRLERLLPSELLFLDRRRGTHREFLRRFAEGELLEYELVAHASRGPMVVCVDGSGSMQGSKEIWAKAVALTLMEIARRERRACLAMVFSDAGQLVEFELLEKASKSGRGRLRREEVLRFAEHFPGGGTSFEGPLTRATDAVTTGKLRRGDVVFITDGEASVSPELLQRISEQRRAHAFQIRGILVNIGTGYSTKTLESFCDDVVSVTDLSSDAVADLFAAV